MTTGASGDSVRVAAGQATEGDRELVKTEWGARLYVAFFVLVLVALGVYLFNPKGGRWDAYHTACEAVEDRLIAPSTAAFPWFFDSDVKITLDGDTYTIIAYVDSQNEMGAQIRQPWTAEVVLDDAGGLAARGVRVGKLLDLRF